MRLNRPNTAALTTPLACLAALLGTTALHAQAQTYTVLYTAPGTPGIANPIAEANAQGRDGAIYSTAPHAANGNSALFSISPTGTYNLTNDTSGGSVISGVTLGKDGDFYGTNQNVGSTDSSCGGFHNGCGQLFKITPTGTWSLVHQFDGSDGQSLQSPPIQAANGKFYGTAPTSLNGPSTAYSTTSSGVFTLLHTFTTAEGTFVAPALVLGTDGNFYGVAENGGSSNSGTIFKMTPSGAVTVLHNIQGSDGFAPSEPLIQGTDGVFYGTTSGAGSSGTAFSITANGTFTLLHTFGNATDGTTPSSSLTQGTDGNLYGVTGGGGALGGGTIYSMTTKGTNFKVLHNFNSTSYAAGFQPQSPTTQSTTGLFFGTTTQGGACPGNNNGCGVIYSLDMGLAPFIALEQKFATEGSKIGILGQGFSLKTTVSFNGIPATSIVNNSANFLTVTVPQGALTGSVSVANKTGPLVSNTIFRVTPTFATANPTSGAPGTSVTFVGTGLTQTNAVLFSGTTASFQVISDTTVSATVPAGAQTGTIQIHTKGGAVVNPTPFTVN